MKTLFVLLICALLAGCGDAGYQEVPQTNDNPEIVIPRCPVNFKTYSSAY